MKNPNTTKWYAAHIMSFHKWKEGRQKKFLVWENICLVGSDSAKAAWRKAETIGRKHYESKEFVRVDGRWTRQVFVGIRKIISCSPDDIKVAFAPDDKVSSHIEVSYSEYEVEGRQTLKKLAEGKPTHLTYKM